MSKRSSKSSIGSRRSSISNKSSIKENSNSTLKDVSSSRDTSTISFFTKIFGKGQTRHALSMGSLNDCVANGTGPYHVPWGALIIVIACVLIHLQVFNVPYLRVDKACLGLYQIFYLQERLRALTCHFVHSTNWELVFQMLSLLWKGRIASVLWATVYKASSRKLKGCVFAKQTCISHFQELNIFSGGEWWNGIFIFSLVYFWLASHSLEKCCRPRYFILMMIMFVPCCSLSLCIIHKVLADYIDAVFITQCFYGFGSINFALKVIKMYQSVDGGLQCMFGDYLCIKLKYFSWVELVVSHSISSTATIAANMAGVVVGLLYICGPLKILVDIIYNITTGYADGLCGLTKVIACPSIRLSTASLTEGASRPSMRVSQPALSNVRSSPSLRSVKSVD